MSQFRHAAVLCPAPLEVLGFRTLAFVQIQFNVFVSIAIEVD
jgi:hypothetical protein